MNFRFEYLTNIDEVTNFILGDRLWIPRSDYPDYQDWVDKVYQDLKNGVKYSLGCFSSGYLVGSIIFQQHKNFTEAVELKNLTICPEYRNRFVASFLLKNAEVEGCLNFGKNIFLVDAKSNNIAIRQFLFLHKYSVVGETDLYNLGAGQDIIYEKRIHNRTI